MRVSVEKDAESLSRKRRPTREVKAKQIAYMFVLPAFLFFLVIVAYPLVSVIWDSFHDKNLLNTGDGRFVGLANYVEVIRSEYFVQAFVNTGIWTIVSVAGEYILGIVAALALAQRIRGRAIFRGIIIIPWIVPVVVAGLTWTWMLTPDYGVLNSWLVKLGLLDEPYYFLGEPDTALLSIIIVNIWRSFPFYTITLLAALQSIPRDIYEAAALDGIGPVGRFFKITLPQLKSVSIVLIMIHIIWTAINFDFIWVMTEGGPVHSSETLPIMIYRFAMQELNIGLASALASLMLAFMIIGFMMYYLYIQRKSGNRGGM
ncbi:multiple sugar transport system permease protein [Terribacillus halophilus]|uniref:Multiple sugar transport system permease protein n=1 Tax=Terribacillus halophilus TaxID=361279 RepID=A0A1G6WWA6_9BACI|nr:multiple sugar transport system permease protein [Terribacillus halophilus]